MTTGDGLLAALRARLAEIGPLAVAVSGGVDSMTLAAVAHDTLGDRALMLHAVSPAVPAAASERVRRYAAARGWRLQVVDAGEFADPDYLRNPVERCYFCKTHLYRTMSRLTAATDRVLASGTNRDDLGDYRPGLMAAAEHRVHHPYVEADIDKAGVRAIATGLGLSELAALPAAPCLSSRVETGIRIDPTALTAVDAAETLLRQQLQPRTVRCRVRRAAIDIELDPDTLAGLPADRRAALAAEVSARFGAYAAGRPVTFSAYRMGSAFLRGESR